MKPTMPKPSIVQTSKRRCEIAYEPMTHSTNTIGMMISRGICSTLSSGRTSSRPNTKIPIVA